MITGLFYLHILLQRDVRVLLMITHENPLYLMLKAALFGDSYLIDRDGVSSSVCPLQTCPADDGDASSAQATKISERATAWCGRLTIDCDLPSGLVEEPIRRLRWSYQRLY